MRLFGFFGQDGGVGVGGEVVQQKTDASVKETKKMKEVGRARAIGRARRAPCTQRWSPCFASSSIATSRNTPCGHPLFVSRRRLSDVVELKGGVWGRGEV